MNWFWPIVNRLKQRVDWLLVGAIIPLLAAGLVTMNSLVGDEYFFNHQLIWIFVGLVVFLIFSLIDWRFLRRSSVLVALFAAGLALLTLLLAVGSVTKGAKGWFSLGLFSFQPADLMKLILILVLAKYLSRRHIEIANIRHIVVSALYAFLPFMLIFLQPDFGSAIIIFAIWLGLVLFSGISKKHLLLTAVILAVAFLGAWNGLLKEHQKERVLTFIHPLADIQGAGYSSFQSRVAVGSGQLFGKGVGYGTQSRLKFLPEYETDFIFAAFVEEWGFVGALFLFILFGIVIWRILRLALISETNFESLFGIGVAVILVSHFIIHVGMNIGLLPVTGLPLPFVSYGGSHLLIEFASLGILMGMSAYSRGYHRADIKNEFFGGI